MSSANAFAGLVSRKWELPSVGVVEIVHNTVMGGYAVYLGGEEVPGGNGTLSMFGSTAEIAVNSGSTKARVLIRRKGTDVIYTCVCNGTELVEESQQLAQQSGVRFVNVTVPSAFVGLDEVGGKAAWYQVCSHDPETGATITTVHRRFSEFASLRESVLGAVGGSALGSKVPSLPPKQSMFVNHFAADFIQGRMSEMHPLEGTNSEGFDTAHIFLFLCAQVHWKPGFSSWLACQACTRMMMS